MLTLNLNNPVYKPEIRFSQYVDLRLTSAKVTPFSDTTKFLRRKIEKNLEVSDYLRIFAA